ncbi:E3 SUMO-protein ligase TRIM60-like [Symsagittifera roscoffensis]|uniref:E3 SUMO-protein ligase TRIM60-like n=1 Tax=Symsagittifera roscoffensis TaxID=84072 RepID=UPI00307BCE54
MFARENESCVCRICNNIFLNARMLPCGHSFCGPSGRQGSSPPTDCLGKHLQECKERGSFVCPRDDCKSAIAEPNEKSTDFPFNYPLYARAEQMKAVLRRQGKEEEPNSPIKCLNHNQLRTYYCMKDREALCNKCRLSTDHNSHADNKGTIITIEETRQRQVDVKTGVEYVESESNCTLRRLEKMTFHLLQFQNQFQNLLLVEEQASSSIYEDDHSFRVSTFKEDFTQKANRYEDMKTKFVQDIKGLLDDIMTEYAVLKEAMELANKPPDN